MMRRRWWKWFAFFAPMALLVPACGVDHLSVGAGAPDGAAGTVSSTPNGMSGGSGDFNALPSAGASFAGGGSLGAGANDSAGGRATGGSAGRADVGTNNAGTSSAGTAGSTPSLVCDPGRADCDGDPANGCEILLQSATSCGAECSEVVVCDTNGSAATCVNGGCTSEWAAWLMPNSPITDPDAPNQAEYVDNGDGTVRDVITGLIWQKANRPGIHDWEEAMSYCARLTFAGFSDWRLPGRLELITIEDPSFDQGGVFQYVLQDSMQLAVFWSSTIGYGSNGATAWFVGGASESTRPKTEEKYVRCVR